MTNYRCIHCGVPCSALIQTFNTPTNIRLLPCTSCSARSRDHYVEYELILVFIDLALVRLSAYRHIMFNRFQELDPFVGPKSFLQLWFLFFHLEAYSKWLTCVRLSGHQDEALTSWLRWHPSHLIVLFIAMFESAAYMLTILICGSLVRVPGRKVVIIGSFAKFGVLIMMIWDSHNMFVRNGFDFFTSLAHVMCLQACVQDPRSCLPTCIVGFAWIVRATASYAFVALTEPAGEIRFSWFPPEALVQLQI
eukprot:GEMP01053785.1.p1 GENE.GEMP01053785.1~~GEMP01053785.1.p1  ORF type:complete len:250 (+),score=16.40 GEMP01053785.1:154-903(+)